MKPGREQGKRTGFCSHVHNTLLSLPTKPSTLPKGVASDFSMRNFVPFFSISNCQKVEIRTPFFFCKQLEGPTFVHLNISNCQKVQVLVYVFKRLPNSIPLVTSTPSYRVWFPMDPPARNPARDIDLTGRGNYPYLQLY